MSDLFFFNRNDKSKGILIVCISILMVCLSGCSRATMNAQIAESIGTLGMYENNEPVETPKMKAEKQMEQSKESEEQDISGHIDRAARLAGSYDYSSALEELALIDEEFQDDERVVGAKIEYQRLQNNLQTYNGIIPHLSVKSLIVDPQRAFVNNDMAYFYDTGMLTVDEFKAILQSLYDRNYILMDIHDVVLDVENKDGTRSFALNMPIVPNGKTPIILSFTEANYYDNLDGGGFAERLVLAEDGTVQNAYVDVNGKTQIGAYDVIPIVDAFVEKHPDFSLRGAKGIVSVTGYQGVFGYGIESSKSEITAIANALKADGWQFACNGYTGSAMESELDYDAFVEEMEDWIDQVQPLVGKTDMLIYPFGEEVITLYAKHIWLLEHDFRFLFGLWSTAEFLEVKSDYVRQTRRILDGYNLINYKDSMSDFFDVDRILDKSRPSLQ